MTKPIRRKWVVFGEDCFDDCVFMEGFSFAPPFFARTKSPRFRPCPSEPITCWSRKEESFQSTAFGAGCLRACRKLTARRGGDAVEHSSRRRAELIDRNVWMVRASALHQRALQSQGLQVCNWREPEARERARRGSSLGTSGLAHVMAGRAKMTSSGRYQSKGFRTTRLSSAPSRMACLGALNLAFSTRHGRGERFDE